MTPVVWRYSLPPIREAAVADVERKLGLVLPGEYRAFLLAQNGGRPKPDVFPIRQNPSGDQGILQLLYGIRDGDENDLATVARIYRDRVPANLLPIGHDVGGDLLLLSVAGSDTGCVYFWEHEEEAPEGVVPGYGNIYPVADSFTELLNSLKK